MFVFLRFEPKAANDRCDWNEAAHYDWELRYAENSFPKRACQHERILSDAKVLAKPTFVFFWIIDFRRPQRDVDR